MRGEPSSPRLARNILPWRAQGVAGRSGWFYRTCAGKARACGFEGKGLIGEPDILALLSGAMVGLVLALIGGGGSILATPLLLYVVGVRDPHMAIGTSALAVSVNAFANLVPHARAGNVRWRCAGVFTLAGVTGALIGAAIGKLTNAHILLPLFALAMIGVGVAMLQKRALDGASLITVTPGMAGRLGATGAGVGALSGFFGIGGGFLIVPGLMSASGMSLCCAIATSLIAVGAFGATTAATYAMSGWVDWRVAALFIAGGVVGGLGGAALNTKLANERGALQRVFAVVVFVAAAYVLWRSFVLVS